MWLEEGRVRAVAPHRELWCDATYRALFLPEEPAAVTHPSAGPARGAGEER